MAMLWTIGSYIENSGIDIFWIESELYGPSTVKQTLDGKHVRRGENAHMKSLQSLFSLYQEAFFKQEAELYRNLQRLTQELGAECKDGAKALVEKAREDMVNVIISFSVLEKMAIFDAAHSNEPMFQVIRHYMCMVMEMMGADTALEHINRSLKVTCKYQKKKKNIATNF